MENQQEEKERAEDMELGGTSARSQKVRRIDHHPLQQRQEGECAEMNRQRRGAVAWAAARVMLVLLGPLVYTLVVGLRQQAEPSLRTGVGGVLFCEVKRSAETSFFCQTASGLSALSYLFLPLQIAISWSGRKDKAQPPRGRWKKKAFAIALPWTRPSVENALLALSSVYLCVGNLAMHGFCTENGHLLDATSMNVCAAFFLAFSVGRLLRRPLAACCFAGGEEVARLRNEYISERVLFFSFLTAACTWVLFRPVDNNFALFASIFGSSFKSDEYFNMLVDFIFLTILVETIGLLVYRQGRNWTVLAWHLLTVSSFGVGKILWSLSSDAESAICHPSSFFQPHALWHGATALAICFFHRRMQCKDVGPGSPPFSKWFEEVMRKKKCCRRHRIVLK
jgi:hypothetical protein